MEGGFQMTSLPDDKTIEPLFQVRSPENRNALWDAFSACWVLPDGDRLSHAWDGFQTFDPSKAAPGFMAKTFLRLVGLSCRSVRRQDRSLNGAALRVPFRARRQVVRLTPEEWAEIAEEPEDTAAATLAGVDGQIRVVGLQLLGVSTKRLEEALKRATREGA